MASTQGMSRPEILDEAIRRMIEGIYEHGEYAKADDMRTGQVTRSLGSAAFTIDAGHPNEDRVTMTVVVTLV